MCKSVSVFLLGLALVTVGCGGDDDAAGNLVDSCPANSLSTPNSDMDPCKGSDDKPLMCPTATWIPFAKCDAAGKWARSPMDPDTVDCKCYPDAASAMAASAVCGNMKVEAGEDCEGATVSTTCATLMPGTTGMVKCSSCKYDATMCKDMTEPMGGNGG